MWHATSLSECPRMLSSLIFLILLLLSWHLACLCYPVRWGPSPELGLGVSALGPRCKTSFFFLPASLGSPFFPFPYLCRPVISRHHSFHETVLLRLHLSVSTACFPHFPSRELHSGLLPPIQLTAFRGFPLFLYLCYLPASFFPCFPIGFRSRFLVSEFGVRP